VGVGGAVIVVVELASVPGLAVEPAVELVVGFAVDVVVGRPVVTVAGLAGRLVVVVVVVVVVEPAPVPAFGVPVPVDGIVVDSALGWDEVVVVSSEEMVTTPRPMTAKG